MSRLDSRWITALVALAGAAASIAAVVHFLLTMLHNRLPRPGANVLRDHYLAVGQSYTQGFIVGFFLCFSLAMLAVTLAGWRAANRSTGETPTDGGPQSIWLEKADSR